MSREICDDGDCAEVYAESERVARKPTKCSACGMPIRQGDTYSYTFILYDGESSQIRRCARCQLIHKHLRARCEAAAAADPGEPERYPDEFLACGDDYRNLWGEDPPEEIAALAFALPGETKL